jgi:hypothetical protein
MTDPLSPDYGRQLREFLVEHYNLSELETLSFDLGVKHENFLDRTLDGTARSLIDYFSRRGSLDPLLQALRRTRPAQFVTFEGNPRVSGRAARVFICYKRHVKRDAALARRIYDTLGQAGHKPFIDRAITIGQDWAKVIEREIEASDFVIVLLSEQSVLSEMLTQEVEYAFAHYKRTGKPRLLPVRLDFDAPLPSKLTACLDSVQYAMWRPRRNHGASQVIRALLDAIDYADELLDHTGPAPVRPADTPATPEAVPPRPTADLEFIDSLVEPGGAIADRDLVYVERNADRQLERELRKVRGTTTTIRAPRQSGKSSLLMRGIAQTRAQNAKTVFLDIQQIDDPVLHDNDRFFRYLALTIAEQTGFTGEQIERAWNSSGGSSDKLTGLLEREILPRIDTTVVVAIDEADRVLQKPINDQFFALLRSWHNRRAYNQLWDRLDILLVISTEPSLLIKDRSQSPFNVGSRIELEDFGIDEVRTLNQHYRYPFDEDQLAELYDLLSGHPFLTSKAMYLAVTGEMSWEKLKKVAATDKSPFSDHLRHYWWLLRDEPELIDALRQALDARRCSDTMFYRLSRAGLLVGESHDHCAFRCQLYESYFRAKL